MGERKVSRTKPNQMHDFSIFEVRLITRRSDAVLPMHSLYLSFLFRTRISKNTISPIGVCRRERSAVVFCLYVVVLCFVSVTYFHSIFPSSTRSGEWKFQNVRSCTADESLVDGENVLLWMPTISGDAKRSKSVCRWWRNHRIYTSRPNIKSSRYYFPYRRSLTHNVYSTFPWSLTKSSYMLYIHASSSASLLPRTQSWYAARGAVYKKNNSGPKYWARRWKKKNM